MYNRAGDWYTTVNTYIIGKPKQLSGEIEELRNYKSQVQEFVAVPERRVREYGLL